MKHNKKAQVTLYIYFVIALLIMITIVAVLAPMGVQFNSALYAAGEDILADSRPYINEIDDLTVQGQINSSVNSALLAGQNNIDVNAAIFQYGWVLVVILAGVVVFLHTRRMIETGGFV